MHFSLWLERDEKDFSFFRNLILGKLGLDGNEGLSQRLNTYDSNNLISKLDSLGEFKNLPQTIQDQVKGQISSGIGTLSDLIRIMSSSGRELGESNSFQLYSWLAPNGKFHPLTDQTHAQYASALTYLKYPLSMGKLYDEGWQRITYYGEEIYSNNPTIAPNEKQKKALVQAAKDNFSQRIIWDNDYKSPVIWHADYD